LRLKYFAICPQLNLRLSASLPYREVSNIRASEQTHAGVLTQNLAQIKIFTLALGSNESDS